LLLPTALLTAKAVLLDSTSRSLIASLACPASSALEAPTPSTQSTKPPREVTSARPVTTVREEQARQPWCRAPLELIELNQEQVRSLSAPSVRRTPTPQSLPLSLAAPAEEPPLTTKTVAPALAEACLETGRSLTTPVSAREATGSLLILRTTSSLKRWTAKSSSTKPVPKASTETKTKNV